MNFPFYDLVELEMKQLGATRGQRSDWGEKEPETGKVKRTGPHSTGKWAKPIRTIIDLSKTFESKPAQVTKPSL